MISFLSVKNNSQLALSYHPTLPYVYTTLQKIPYPRIVSCRVIPSIPSIHSVYVELGQKVIGT